jgi:hypothetical protein
VAHTSIARVPDPVALTTDVDDPFASFDDDLTDRGGVR